MRTAALDKYSLGLVKKIYPIGAKVEALKVEGISRGTRGVVFDIAKNGDVVVNWVDGGSSRIDRGNESIRVVRDGFCILGRTVDECEDGVCKECGWNNRVHAQRIRRIRNNEMVEKAGGVRSLRVKKTGKPI